VRIPAAVGILVAMDIDVRDRQLSQASEQALRRAVHALESERLISRLSEYASQPLDRILNRLPRVATDTLNDAVRTSLYRCLDVAVRSLGRDRSAPRPWLSSTVAGLTGGIGGAFGFVALPIELPVTTTLMFRSIAQIARSEGEDLTSLPSRLACMEVFALGPQPGGDHQGDTPAEIDVGYYAARTLLTRLTNEAAILLLERGMADTSLPVVARLVAQISSRFGVTVSERIAAGAVPVLGAVSGAAVNALFMDHFQRLAQGHFTVRRLEREYGASLVREHYAVLARAYARARV
jgi:EcsC family protein